MKKINFIVLIIIVGLAAWNHYENNQESQRKSVALYNEYPIIPLDSAIDGSITHIKFFDRNNRFNPNFACVTINDEYKYSIWASNELKSGFDLMDLLEVNMRIFKSGKSDTIYLLLTDEKDGPVYKFVTFGKLGYPRWHSKSK